MEPLQLVSDSLPANTAHHNFQDRGSPNLLHSMMKKMKTTRCNTPTTAAAIGAWAAVLLLVAPFATAQDFPKITPELYDKLNKDLDATWPHDPAVPKKSRIFWGGKKTVAAPPISAILTGMPFE